MHVYLGHGDSDKGVSVSNQVKAYDFCFLAGQAALDRTASAVMLYDAAARSVLIGQPQLDGRRPSSPRPDPDGADRALRADVGGVAAVGVVRLARDPRRRPASARCRARYRVVYRPHPLNGVIRPSYAAADAAVRELADRVDTDVPLEQSFADADLLVTDVSAVTLDWLPTGKPLLVTTPAVPYPPSALMDVVPQLAPDADVAAVVAEHLADDPAAADRAALVEHYLGDPTPGGRDPRFVAACEDAMRLRDASGRPAGPPAPPGPDGSATSPTPPRHAPLPMYLAGVVAAMVVVRLLYLGSPPAATRPAS